MRSFFRELTLKPQGAIVVVAAFLPIIAIVSMFPVVPSLIEHFSADQSAKVKVPAMVAAPGLAIAVLAPFVGILIDRFGRRRLLLWCTFLYGLFGAAPLLLTDLDAIFVTRLLLGVTEAGILTTVTTLIGDYWDDRGRKNWLFVQGVVGPFLGAFVTLAAGYSVQLIWNGVFLVYMIAFPIWLGMLFYVFEPVKPKTEIVVQQNAGSNFPLVTAVTIASVTLLSSALYYTYIINGGLALKEIGITDPAKVGQLTFVPSLFVMLGAAIFRWLANRSAALQLSVFLTLMGSGLAAIGLAKTVPIMTLALILQQTAAGMAVPTLIAWTQSKFCFEHRGRAMGIWTGAFFFGQFSSPWFVHLLDVRLGSMQASFLVAGSSAVILVALVGALSRLQLRAS